MRSLFHLKLYCMQDCPEGSPDFREEQCLRLRELRSDGNWSLADKGEFRERWFTPGSEHNMFPRKAARS